MATYTFQEVKVKATRFSETGKRQQKTFTATVNPWNKNADGSAKSEQQVRDDLRTEAAAWVLETKADKGGV